MIKKEETNPLGEENLSQIRIEDLFDSSRFQKTDFLKAALYFPFGIILLIARLIICIASFSFLILLHPSSYIRNFLLKKVCKVLGYIVEIEGKPVDITTKVIVANHVSILDRLAVNIMVPCNVVTNDFSVQNIDSLSFWKDDDYPRFAPMSSSVVDSVKFFVAGSPVPILNFPEGAISNGKVGLLKFHPEIFKIGSPIQPILIHISSSTFTIASSSVLRSSNIAFLLWSFFLPYTSFIIKTLPRVEKYPNESEDDFSKRVQKSMASDMKLVPTGFTAADKAEYQKRLQTISNVKKTFYTSTRPNDTAGSAVYDQPSCSRPLQTRDSKNLNMTATSFGKTPKERMLSYQQRRDMLMEAARYKYLEKHNF